MTSPSGKHYLTNGESLYIIVHVEVCATERIVKLKLTQKQIEDYYDECMAMKKSLRHIEQMYNEGIEYAKQIVAHYEGPDHPFVKGREKPSKTKGNIVDIKDFANEI